MKAKILVIGRHPQILDVVVRLINQNPDWEAKGTGDEAEALTLFTQQIFDIVLLSSGIDEETEQRLCSAFILHHPEVILLQHYGGGSGLLTGEIRQALEDRG